MPLTLKAVQPAGDLPELYRPGSVVGVYGWGWGDLGVWHVSEGLGVGCANALDRLIVVPFWG